MEPVKIFLHRTKEDEHGTHGVIKDEEGKVICYTIELPWLNNQRKVSCIPEGTYNCSAYTSKKYPDCWELQDVPDRDKILIHAGNTIKDTQGCILVGTSPSETGVAMSRKAMSKLREMLPPHFVVEIFSGD
jgi:hypothetical protein